MDVQKIYAFVLGLVLAAIGIWGLFTDLILGLFGVNIIQDILHLIAAVFGIYSGVWGQGKMYNLFIGWIGLALGVSGFIPLVKDFLLNFLNINTATTVLHIAIGIVSLAVAYLFKE